jgi:hypothetical protein
MQIDEWLKAACDDAERRGLPDLKPLLETLARSTTALREADRSIRAAMPDPSVSPENLPHPHTMEGE